MKKLVLFVFLLSPSQEGIERHKEVLSYMRKSFAALFKKEFPTYTIFFAYLKQMQGVKIGLAIQATNDAQAADRVDEAAAQFAAMRVGGQFALTQ